MQSDETARTSYFFDGIASGGPGGSLTRDNARVREILWKWPAQETDLMAVQEPRPRGEVAVSYM